MGKLVYLRYFLFVLLTLCYQNEADIDAVNVTCNEAWVHLHGNAFITFVVSATIICHITFKKPPRMPVSGIDQSQNISNDLELVHKAKIKILKRFWYVDLLCCGIDLLILTVCRVNTNVGIINAILFF